MLMFAKEYIEDFELLNDKDYSNEQKNELIDKILTKYNMYFKFYNINMDKRKGPSLLYYKICHYVYLLSQEKFNLCNMESNY